MSNKRAREEEEEEEEQKEKPNAFGSYLLRKIYVYAEVRDGDELRKVREELLVRTKAYEKLLASVISGNVAEPGWMCENCGNVGVSLRNRTLCGGCRTRHIQCSQLPWCGEPKVCGSGKHKLCGDCLSYYYEDCVGNSKKRCTVTTWN